MTNPKKEIKLIAAKLNVKVEFRKVKTAACHMHKRKIVIPNENFDRDTLLSIFFHEYAHQICYDLHIYDNYHRGNPESKKFRRIMTSAEIYVDKMGLKLTKLYDKTIKYYGPYLMVARKDVHSFLDDYYNITKMAKVKIPLDSQLN